MLSRLIRQTKPLFYAAIVMSVLAGATNALLVSFINEILNSSSEDRYDWLLGFAGLAIFSLVAQVICYVLFERLSHGAQANLRQYISELVMKAGYQHLEKVGSARVKSSLTEHSLRVAEFFVSLPGIITNAVIVVGCLMYMAILSWKVFLLAGGVLVLGSIGYHIANLRAIRFLDDASVEQDRLFGHFDSLTDGAKELRLNYSKRASFAEWVLGRSIESVRKHRVIGMSIFLMASSWGRFLIFAFIGTVMLLLAGDDGQIKVMTGFSLLIIFMVTPLEVLLMNIPRANLAKIAAARIEEMSAELVSEENDATSAPVSFQKLQLSSVMHRYYHEKSDEFFALGPIDISFKPGELVFLVGGNGSGKTTFAKLLVGLYVPESGTVSLDGCNIDNSNRDHYRQLFSCIFSDFHLFEQLLESPRADLDAEGNRLLEKLHLEHKVQIKDGAFTTRSLSQGQRKRLALVVSYLENRPFLLFDEWAADQDPVFKDVFYRELLPELKAQGKTVLVISHDDHYFHMADRLLKMENGQLTERQSQSKPEDEALPLVV